MAYLSIGIFNIMQTRYPDFLDSIMPSTWCFHRSTLLGATSLSTRLLHHLRFNTPSNGVLTWFIIVARSIPPLSWLKADFPQAQSTSEDTRIYYVVFWSSKGLKNGIRSLTHISSNSQYCTNTDHDHSSGICAPSKEIWWDHSNLGFCFDLSELIIYEFPDNLKMQPLSLSG